MAVSSSAISPFDVDAKFQFLVHQALNSAERKTKDTVVVLSVGGESCLASTPNVDDAAPMWMSVMATLWKHYGWNKTNKQANQKAYNAIRARTELLLFGVFADGECRLSR